MSGVEFQLVKIQTCILKVHIHCEGCAKKVKKVLKGIEGVYGVDINLEEQKVIVFGMVDSEKLIRKLNKSKKHAELWSPPNHTESIPINVEEALNNNWIINGRYDHNTMHHLINGGHDTPNVRSPSVIMDASSGGGEEYYTDDISDIEYLMNNSSMKRASSMENKDYYYPPLDNNNNIRRSIIGFQDLAGTGETKFEDTFDNVLPIGLPTYPPGMIMKMMNSTPEEEHVSHHQTPELMNSPMSNFRVIPNTMVHGDGYRNRKPQIFMR